MYPTVHEWSKTWAVSPRDNLLSHEHMRQQRVFKPSYEAKNCGVCMNLLLGWDYARIWQKERDEFVKNHERKTKPKFIKNNYDMWVKKRTGKVRKPLCHK